MQTVRPDYAGSDNKAKGLSQWTLPNAERVEIVAGSMSDFMEVKSTDVCSPIFLGYLPGVYVSGNGQGLLQPVSAAFEAATEHLGRVPRRGSPRPRWSQVFPRVACSLAPGLAQTANFWRTWKAMLDAGAPEIKLTSIIHAPIRSCRYGFEIMGV